MSIIQPTAPPDRGVSPLMSNNPFRNRIVSTISPADTKTPANPFLDVNEVAATTTNKLAESAARMNLQPTPSSQANAIVPPRPLNGTLRPPPNGVPMRPFARPPGPQHRPSDSAEERQRRQRPTGDVDVFADPAALGSDGKPRRNSESSIRDKARPPLTDEERKRRERRYRESKKDVAKPGKTTANRKLDIIDELDVTSIYGTGLFHHDGPFDACNPHRNRKKEKYAPMQAFPKDSINMVMGGSGPVNKQLDYDRIHGRGQEAHVDFSEAAVIDEEPAELRRSNLDGPMLYNAGQRQAVHGEESMGLGTTTFLEGTPASRAAIQRRESELDAQQIETERPGLARKKSLAQKIRGGVRSRDVRTPGSPPPLTGQSDSGVNPFFANFEASQSLPPRKDPVISFTDQPAPSRARAPSSPKRSDLERRITSESAVEVENKPGGGLLGRMKSLKSRRPSRRDTGS